MLQCALGPALLSPVTPIAARIPSSNAGERGPRMNAECGNYDQTKKQDKIHGDRLNIKMPSYQYRDPHVKDKTASRPSDL